MTDVTGVIPDWGREEENMSYSISNSGSTVHP